MYTKNPIFSCYRVLFFTLYFLSLPALKVTAQFYTLKPETRKIFKTLLSKVDSISQRTLPKEVSEEKLVSMGKGYKVTISKDVPVFVNLTDSLLSGLIKERMNVCLPLDLLNVNSAFGIRRDPISLCRKFHDGIDFQCRYQRVYSMLPGIVREIHHGKKEYGNFVLLNYGNLQCLYGHLSHITVKQNEIVEAGTIIGISGSTGKSTGPHLHLRIEKDGKGVDPEPFIAYLNHYITMLQDRIRYLQDGTLPDPGLNMDRLYATLQKYGIRYPKIVLAQAILETGYFTSRVCLDKNNLFGLRSPTDGSYYNFDTWEESVKAYRDYVQYKYRNGDYYTFLNRIGYAEDRTYTLKLRKIVDSL